MTIAVVWREDGYQWCAADTRLVAGKDDDPTTDMASKIYSIPVSIAAFDADGFPRMAHYWTQFGFVYAGAAQPASMTAVTASTLLQKLVRAGDRANPPLFEDIAQLVCRLSDRFMRERRQMGGDGVFSAALFGWCPHSSRYKVAHIDGRTDGGFRVELTYPEQPAMDGEPWLILGSGRETFLSTMADYRSSEPFIKKRVARRVIDKMVAQQANRTVGGATSIGAARENGFDIFYAVEPIEPGKPQARRVFNGLDLDIDVGPVGEYIVGAVGIA